MNLMKTLIDREVSRTGEYNGGFPAALTLIGMQRMKPSCSVAIQHAHDCCPISQEHTATITFTASSFHLLKAMDSLPPGRGYI